MLDIMLTSHRFPLLKMSAFSALVDCNSPPLDHLRLALNSDFSNLLPPVRDLRLLQRQSETMLKTIKSGKLIGGLNLR